MDYAYHLIGVDVHRRASTFGPVKKTRAPKCQKCREEGHYKNKCPMSLAPPRENTPGEFFLGGFSSDEEAEMHAILLQPPKSNRLTNEESLGLVPLGTEETYDEDFYDSLEYLSYQNFEPGESILDHFVCAITKEDFAITRRKGCPT